jgi:hypothetical protein
LINTVNLFGVIKPLNVMETKMITPFSNGTEVMCWMDQNCDRCVKAFHVKNGNWPSERTLKEYVRIGKYCKLQYHLDIAHITSEIPVEIADQIGYNEWGGLKSQCMFFSDNEDDGFKYPPRTEDVPLKVKEKCISI